MIEGMVDIEEDARPRIAPCDRLVLRYFTLSQHYCFSHYFLKERILYSIGLDTSFSLIAPLKEATCGQDVGQGRHLRV